MARIRRITVPGLIHHVINRGNNRQVVFHDKEDFELYLGLVYRFKRRYQFKLFAYCLMTNHIHLLVEVGEAGTLSQIMHSITTAHTRHYHHKYQSTGHVWQGRFKSPIVSDDAYMLTVMQYIEQNPVRAGLASAVDQYRWSSYRLNVRTETSRLLDREQNPVYQGMGNTWAERTAHYRQKMQMSLEEKELGDIRKSVKGDSSYSSEEFKQKVSSLLVPQRPPGPGRPRKKTGIIV